jgi:hypothetical protein
VLYTWRSSLSLLVCSLCENFLSAFSLSNNAVRHGVSANWPMRAGSKGRSSCKLQAGRVFDVGLARSQHPDIDVYRCTVSAAPPCLPKYNCNYSWIVVQILHARRQHLGVGHCDVVRKLYLWCCAIWITKTMGEYTEVNWSIRLWELRVREYYLASHMWARKREQCREQGNMSTWLGWN